MTALSEARLGDGDRRVRRVPHVRLGALGRLSERRGWAWLLLLPSLVMILAIILYPTGYGLWLGLHEMRLTRPDRDGFVGLKHFIAIADDPIFWLSLRNTLVWVVGSVVGELALGLAAALVLNKDLPGFKLAAALVLLPWFLPNVVAGNIWAMMLDPRLGVINDVLVRMGVLTTYRAWFAEPDLALAASMAV
ncbi:MAG: carbohydrate ABC transporter permease [Rhodospirillales bacterium]